MTIHLMFYLKCSDRFKALSDATTKNDEEICIWPNEHDEPNQLKYHLCLLSMIANTIDTAPRVFR